VTSLLETARLFLRLGATAFGGPAAHIALMDEEIVRRRGWMRREQFLDYVGVTSLIPGPNSTELAMLVGLSRHGWPGMLVAGCCFILPATVIVAAIAWTYVRYGALPQVAGVLAGVTPVVLAVVARAIRDLARTAVKSVALVAILIGAILAVGAGVNELIVLGAAAMLHGVASAGRRWRAAGAAAVLLLQQHGLTASATLAAQTVPFSLWTMWVVFAKIGAVLFGSGYVLLAFLRADFVDRLGWLTERQLLDAVAVGQVTPGPLFTTATFVGYLLGGMPGAVVATVAIFLPGFLFVAISGPFVARVRRSRFAGAALDGVNAASLALMTVVIWQLARTALVSPLPVVVFLASLVLLLRSTVNATWLLAAGAIAGWALSA
jgi:chromate transporter